MKFSRKEKEMAFHDNMEAHSKNRKKKIKRCDVEESFLTGIEKSTMESNGLEPVLHEKWNGTK